MEQTVTAPKKVRANSMYYAITVLNLHFRFPDRTYFTNLEICEEARKNYPKIAAYKENGGSRTGGDVFGFNTHGMRVYQEIKIQDEKLRVIFMTIDNLTKLAQLIHEGQKELNQKEETIRRDKAVKKEALELYKLD